MKLCVTCRKPAPNHVICSGCVERAELIMFAVTPWTKFEQATLHPDVAAEGFSECYKNSRYTVLWRNVESEFGELVHLYGRARADNATLRIVHAGKHVCRLLHKAGLVEILSAESCCEEGCA